MKINQLRKQRILALIVAVTLLSTSFGYGPAVSADEPEATTEQVQSTESEDTSAEEPSDEVIEETTDDSPPVTEDDTEDSVEESSVTDTSEDADVQDEDVSDEEATAEEAVEETSDSTEEDASVEDTDEGVNSESDEEVIEDQQQIQQTESLDDQETLEVQTEESMEVKEDFNIYGALSVDVEANGSDGPLVLDFGETYVYTWETVGAKSCIKTSPVEDLNLWVSGVSSVITPEDTLFYPTASSSVTIRIECTNGHSTVSDSVVISLDGHHDEEDDTPPIFILQPTVFATATTSAGVIVNYTLPLAVDNEDDHVEVVCAPVSGSLFELGTTTVTCTATDDAGNTATAIFYVVVTLDTGGPIDDTPPVIAPHTDIYATATTSAGVIVHYDLPEATDDTDYHVEVACVPVSGHVFPIGTTTVTCTAIDDAGNTATSTFKVIVKLHAGVDITPPVIAPHADVYATATTSAGVVVHYDLPEATDDMDYHVDVMCTPASGSLFPVGKTTVTCTATDDAGNTATSTFRVKVILDDGGGDDHKIFVDVKANGSDGPLVLMNEETYVYAWTSKNADTCKLTSPDWFFVGLNGTSSVIAEGHDFYPTASSSVTITIKCWNEHKEAFDSVVVSLATTTPPVDMPPVFGPVEDIHATTSTSTGINVSYPLPTATDDITASTSLVVMCTPASGSLFPVGTTTVNCSVEDEAENTATTSFNVIVTLVDDDDGTGTTTPPIIEVGGLSCAATTTVTITGTAATGTTVTLIGGTGTFMATTSANGTWSATVNLSGATSSNPFSITILDAGGDVVATTSVDVIFDNVAPVLTLNGEASITVIVGNQFTDPGVSVTDNLDASTTVSATGTVDTATVGTYTITYTAVDCAGNMATTSRAVIVEDDSGGGGGGGGSRRRSSNNDDDDTSSVLAGDVSGFLGGIGGIGGGGFFPIPISSFIPGFVPTALAFVPGIPNTGAGGDAGRNLAMLLTALGVASLGFALMRKSKKTV